MAALELHPDQGFDPDEFDRFLGRQPDLGPKWRPAFVRIDHDLPKLSSLKIDKKQLRRDAWNADRVAWRPDRSSGLRPITDEDRAKLDPLLEGSRP